MNLNKINSEMECALSGCKIELPRKGEHETSVKRTQNLFNTIVQATQVTENPLKLARLYLLLEKIGVSSKNCDRRLTFVFLSTIGTVEEKIKVIAPEVLSILSSLPDLRKSSDAVIAEALGLNSWESAGSIEEGKRRIIQCFKNLETNLNLSDLELTTPPPPLCLVLLSSHLTSLDFYNNRLIDTNYSAISLYPLKELIKNTAKALNEGDYNKDLALRIVRALDESEEGLTPLSINTVLKELKKTRIWPAKNQDIIRELMVEKLIGKDLESINLSDIKEKMATWEEPQQKIFFLLEILPLKAISAKEIDEILQYIGPVSLEHIPLIERIEILNSLDAVDPNVKLFEILIVHEDLKSLHTMEKKNELVRKLAKSTFAVRALFGGRRTDNLYVFLSAETPWNFINHLDLKEKLEMVKKIPSKERSMWFLDKKLGFAESFKRRSNTFDDYLDLFVIMKGFKDELSDVFAIYINTPPHLNISQFVSLKSSVKERLSVIAKAAEKGLFLCLDFDLQEDFERLGFLEDIQTARSLEEKIDILNLITKGSLWKEKKKIGHLRDGPNFRSIELESKVSKQEQIASCCLKEKTGIIKALQTLNSLEDRVRYCRDIAQVSDGFISGLRDHFKEIGFIEDLLRIVNSKEREKVDLQLAGDLWWDQERIAKIAPFFDLFTNLIQEIVSKTKGIDQEHVHSELLKFAAYTSKILYDLDQDKVEALLQKAGWIVCILEYQRPHFRYPLMEQLSYLPITALWDLNPQTPLENIRSLILLSRIESLGILDSEEKNQIYLAVTERKFFKDHGRQTSLHDFLLEVVTRISSSEEKGLLNKAIKGLLSRPIGKANLINMRALNQINGVFGGKAFLSALQDNPSNYRAVFMNRFNEAFIGLREIPDLLERFENTFGKFRNPGALFTYLGRINQLSEPIKSLVKASLTQYVDSVLSGTFHELRYNIEDQPNLKRLFGNDPMALESWRRSEEAKSLTLENSSDVKEKTIKEFLKDRVDEGHLAPLSEYPIFKSYLDGASLDLTIEFPKDPKTKIQLALIDLCEGRKTLQKFMDTKPSISLGELDNDIQTLIQKSAFQITSNLMISETDDPCDLLLIGTEIQGSCQRVDGTPNLNRGLLGYLLNGDVKAIVIKNKTGQMVARAIIRRGLIGKAPVILLERVYDNLRNSAVEKEIKNWAIRKAKKEGLSLVSKEVGFGDPCKVLEILKGRSPFVYSDAGRGVLSESCEISGCHFLYKA